MLDDKKTSKAQMAMERLGRPLSSYPRTGRIQRTISYVDKQRLDRAIEPKIRQNEIERRESVESSIGVVVGTTYKDDSLDKSIKDISIKTKA